MIKRLVILALSSTMVFGFAPSRRDRPTLTPQSYQAYQANQAAPDASKGYFLTMLGRDTLAVEEYVFDATGLRGRSVIRSPRTTVREYTALFDTGGNLTNLLLTTKRAGGEVVSEPDYAYSPDSVQVTNRQDTSVTRYTVATQ